MKLLGGKMLVKFNSRGKGGGSGPIDYLLGKDRKRDKARVLRGDSDQTKQLIDSLSFARNYTSGTLSFSEKDIPEHQKQKIMDSFQTALMPGLERNQYDVLWVEHRDKDRLELNFLIPNVELLSGKRLQPYYDKVDRKRVNAWQDMINAYYDFSDPNSPETKRFSVLPHNLPKERENAVKTITNSLVSLTECGAIKNRNDVITELTSNGFVIARETKTSISIKDPEGGKNIRLKGYIYERDFKFSEEIGTRIQSKIASYRAERQERFVKSKQTLEETIATKRKYNTERYRQEPQKTTKQNKTNKIQDVKFTGNRDYHRYSSNTGNYLPANQIRHPNIKEVITNYARHQSRTNACTQFSIATIRAAVRRAISSNRRNKRTSNFIKQLVDTQRKRYLQSKLKQRNKQRDRNEEWGFSMR